MSVPVTIHAILRAAALCAVAGACSPPAAEPRPKATVRPTRVPRVRARRIADAEPPFVAADGAMDESRWVEEVFATAASPEPREIRGHVVDDVGRPVAEARVGAWSVDGPSFLSVPADAGGAFRFSTSASAVGAQAPGHEDVLGISIDDRTDDIRIVLRRLSRVTFRVGAGPAVPERFQLCGERLDSAPRPLLFNETVGAADGAEGVAIAPGRWHLVFAQSGHARIDFEVTPAPGETADLGLIAFDEGVRLEGRVVDADDRPVSGVHVQLGGAGSWRTVRAAADGRFAFDHAPRREIGVRVWADGWLDAEVKANPYVAAVVTMRRGGLVRADVQGVAREPTDEFRFVFVPEDGAGETMRLLERRDGLRVAAGAYQVDAELNGAVVATGTVVVAEGGEATAVLAPPK